MFIVNLNDLNINRSLIVDEIAAVKVQNRIDQTPPLLYE